MRALIVDDEVEMRLLPRRAERLGVTQPLKGDLRTLREALRTPAQP